VYFAIALILEKGCFAKEAAFLDYSATKTQTVRKFK
jgi:hypothetical protein